MARNAGRKLVFAAELLRYFCCHLEQLQAAREVLKTAGEDVLVLMAYLERSFLSPLFRLWRRPCVEREIEPRLPMTFSITTIAFLASSTMSGSGMN